MCTIGSSLWSAQVECELVGNTQAVYCAAPQKVGLPTFCFLKEGCMITVQDYILTYTHFYSSIVQPVGVYMQYAHLYVYSIHCSGSRHYTSNTHIHTPWYIAGAVLVMYINILIHCSTNRHHASKTHTHTYHGISQGLCLCSIRNSGCGISWGPRGTATNTAL